MEYTLDQVPQIAEQLITTAFANQSPEHATLITFSGDLGAGKTTLIQEIAKQLGVTDDLQSPTFVIYKRYVISVEASKPMLPLLRGAPRSGEGYGWTSLIHGDMYRLESAEEIEKLGWNDLIADPKNLICIEWPEKITGAIPEWATCVVIHHLGGDKRSIEI